MLFLDIESTILALFDGSPPCQFTKYEKYIVLGHKMSHFVSLVWKLDNLYYHSQEKWKESFLGREMGHFSIIVTLPELIYKLFWWY